MIDINKLAQFDDFLFYKNLTLSSEFNKYIVEHPDILDKIPDNASVILLPADDPDFCEKMLAMVEHNQSLDELDNRPLIYLRIGKLMPPAPSRISDLQFEEEMLT